MLLHNPMLRESMGRAARSHAEQDGMGHGGPTDARRVRLLDLRAAFRIDCGGLIGRSNVGAWIRVALRQGGSETRPYQSHSLVTLLNTHDVEPLIAQSQLEPDGVRGSFEPQRLIDHRGGSDSKNPSPTR